MKIKLIPSFIVMFIVGMSLVTAVEIYGIRLVIDDTVTEAHQIISSSQHSYIANEVQLHAQYLRDSLIDHINTHPLYTNTDSYNLQSIKDELQVSFLQAKRHPASSVSLNISNQPFIFEGSSELKDNVKLKQIYDQIQLTSSSILDFIVVSDIPYCVVAEPLQRNAVHEVEGFIVCTYPLNISNYKAPLLWDTDNDDIHFVYDSNELTIPFELENQEGAVIYNQTLSYPTDAFDGISLKLYNHSTRILLFISILSILFIATLSHRIHRVLSNIVTSVQKVARGDYRHYILPSVSYELNELSSSINALGQTVEQKIHKTHQNHLEMLNVLINTVEAKDEYTKGHSERVAKISKIISRDFEKVRHSVLNEAALLHDIGKICIPEEILNKKATLNKFEYDIIKSHAVKGEEILKASSMLKDVSTVVRQHHEYYNGCGYPDGLSGTNIALEARILSVADAYDAMTSGRPYKKSMTYKEVMDILISESNKQFDPSVVESFMRHHEEIQSQLMQSTLDANQKLTHIHDVERTS